MVKSLEQHCFASSKVRCLYVIWLQLAAGSWRYVRLMGAADVRLSNAANPQPLNALALSINACVYVLFVHVCVFWACV